MKFVLLSAGLIFGTLLLRRLVHIRRRWRMSKQAGHNVISSAVSSMRLALSENRLRACSGPTPIRVGPHEEELYLASTDEEALSVAYTPKKGTWWAKWRRLDAVSSAGSVEVEFPKGHPATNDLRSLVDIIGARHELPPPPNEDAP